MSVCCVASDTALKDKKPVATPIFGNDLRYAAQEVLDEIEAERVMALLRGKQKKSSYKRPAPSEQVLQLLRRILPFIDACVDDAAYQASAQSFLCRASCDPDFAIRRKALGFLCDNMPTSPVCASVLTTLLEAIDKVVLDGKVPSQFDSGAYQRYLLAGFVIYYISILEEQLLEKGYSALFIGGRPVADIIARFNIVTWMMALERRKQRLKRRRRRARRRRSSSDDGVWSVVSFASTAYEEEDASSSR